MECEGCNDLIKRTILFGKKSSALCLKCKKSFEKPNILPDYSNYVEYLEEEPEVTTENGTEAKSPDDKKDKKSSKCSSQWAGCTMLRKYTTHLVRQIGHRFTDEAQRKAKTEGKLQKKIISLNNTTPKEKRLLLAKAVRLCSKRDYTLAQIGEFLRPKGFPYSAFVDIIESFYKNHLAKTID
ncbi:unnamed protein product [Blepharisma stoltei]|uniref:Uncharacterized protein n=1 Tax=Blepharisma stoltei TaxID=1481888 RepID=A0AAU9JJ40_9CILI|nr:unnamed protein product [Blepharisma stoltei]